MDTVRGFEDDDFGADQHDEADLNVDDNSGFDIGTDERRMHVRAYNHWVSLLKGRAYPSIEDLNPEGIADFGPHSVLLDFTGGIENPSIQFLGRALRDECELDSAITHIAQVPSRSLLSRLTDHYLQIIANRAPIGFEAEFVNTRGHNTLYRGILMPFSSDDDTIDFIYGVINWKEMVDAETQAQLDAEVAAAVSTMAPAAAPPSAPAWADGPSASASVAWAPDAVDGAEGGDDGANDGLPPAMPLADHLMLAQQSAAAVQAADTRSRAALYRALSRAHDFAIVAQSETEDYAELLSNAGITVQARAPMTPVVKLVFGVNYDKSRLTEFATVLDHARRMAVPMGTLMPLLEAAEGGIKGIVMAERALRRPAPRPKMASRATKTLGARAPLASVALATDALVGEFVVLVAHASSDGVLDIVGTMGPNDPLAQKVFDKVAR